MGILRVGRHTVIPPLMQVRTFAPRSAAVAVAGWWEVAGKTCVFAYQPKGAASYAASLSNRANPGTVDAIAGSAPAWNASTGWTTDGSQWLKTDGSVTVAADQSQTLIVRFAGVSGNGVLVGYNIADGALGLNPTFFGGRIYNNGAYTFIGSTGLAAGVMAVAGNQGYMDGSADGATFANTGLPITVELGIFADSIGNQLMANGSSVLALAFYSDTLTAGEVATVSSAMAAL